MKKICFITQCTLPIPTVKGGAVETLVEYILDENEKNPQYDFTVISAADNDAQKKSLNYKYVDFKYIENKNKQVNVVLNNLQRVAQHIGVYGYKTDFLKIDVDYNNVISANEGEAYAQYEKEKYQKLTEDQKCFDITEHVDETYQCCVIGSDTVWNMFDPTYENIPYFVGKEIGCKNIISYAASVGQSRLSKILILKGYKLLPIRELSQIAVRDDKTEKVVKILGKKSVRVLDPTFLYDFPIVKPNDLPRKPYMLIYTYGYNNEEVAAIKNMAKKKGLLTIATGSLCPWADINMVVGSFEWLWLVKNADLIVTGTFHGSVFSIKYNKQFAVLTQGSDKVDSLLSEFGLTDRTATVETIENVLSKDIDYLICHGVCSVEYLKQYISSIEKERQHHYTQCFFRDANFDTSKYAYTLYTHTSVEPDYIEFVKDGLYSMGYHKGITYRENCYHCKYASVKRTGDLTLADYWLIGEKIPFPYEKDNVSLVFVNSVCGERYLRNVIEEGFMTAVERPVSEAVEVQGQLQHPTSKSFEQKIFTKSYQNSGDFVSAISKATEFRRFCDKNHLNRIFNLAYKVSVKVNSISMNGNHNEKV